MSLLPGTIHSSTGASLSSGVISRAFPSVILPCMSPEGNYDGGCPVPPAESRVSPLYRLGQEVAFLVDPPPVGRIRTLRVRMDLPGYPVLWTTEVEPAESAVGVSIPSGVTRGWSPGWHIYDIWESDPSIPVLGLDDDQTALLVEEGRFEMREAVQRSFPDGASSPEDLPIVQGATFFREFQANIDITGGVVEFVFAESSTSEALLTVPAVVVDAGTGRFDLDMTAEQTGDLPLGLIVYRIKITLDGEEPSYSPWSRASVSEL